MPSAILVFGKPLLSRTTVLKETMLWSLSHQSLEGEPIQKLFPGLAPLSCDSTAMGWGASSQPWKILGCIHKHRWVNRQFFSERLGRQAKVFCNGPGSLGELFEVQMLEISFSKLTHPSET